MGYTYGIKWTDELILSELNKMITELKLSTFPTHTEMFDFFGNYKLSVKITKSGGTKKWADIVGLPIKNCESKMGDDFENICMQKLIDFDFDCEKMKPRYPYDLTANGNIKIDVKSGFTVKNENGRYFTFNLEKRNPTCDIYVLYCLNGDKSIYKTFIIPSVFVNGRTQLSMGITSKKYDKFINRWDYFKIYDDFYKKIIGE